MQTKPEHDQHSFTRRISFPLPYLGNEAKRKKCAITTLPHNSSLPNQPEQPNFPFALANGHDLLKFHLLPL